MLLNMKEQETRLCECDESASLPEAKDSDKSSWTRSYREMSLADTDFALKARLTFLSFLIIKLVRLPTRKIGCDAWKRNLCPKS